MNFKPLAGLAALAVASFINTGLARAQEEVRLSAIEMVESKDTIDQITQADMERKTATNLWEAMKGVLGVYQQTSANRGEGAISIRGTSRFQVGMFIDGIPVATSYRNEWDANNALLYDLESIEVSKGYSSPLLVSNNGLGGVLNLRTAKPTKELEFSAKYMNFFDRKLDDQGRLFATSIGTKQEHFYLKATVIQNERDFFTLPSSFTAPGVPPGGAQVTPTIPNEDGGRRNNSDYKNQAVNLLAGWTPTEDVDIMFGFVRQSMEKGQPPNAAQTYGFFDITAQVFNRFFRWPEYETTRYYLNADVNLTEQAHLKAVVYNDEHTDVTQGYTDSSYGTIWFPPDLSGNNATRGTNLGQRYEQYTRGGQLTFDYTFNEANKLAVSAGFRRLSHKGYRNGSGSNAYQYDAEIVEDYYDFGAEYTLKPMDPLTLVFGASSTHLSPKSFEEGLAPNRGPDYGENRVHSEDLFNYQVGAFYDLTDNHEVFATFAKKSRIGSMRERFQAAFSSGVLTNYNPDLKPEHALHYEVGYRGLINDWLKVNSSLFYTDVKDMIINNNTTNRDYFENSQKTEFYGFELGAEALFNQYFSAGLTFNFLEWDNTTKDRADSNLTQLPKYTSTAYAVIAPLEGLSIIPQVNMSSGFYWLSNPDATYYKESPGFATADLKVVYDLKEHLTFELGAKNVFDKEYAYSAYYPEAGRNFFLGLTARY